MEVASRWLLQELQNYAEQSQHNARRVTEDEVVLVINPQSPLVSYCIGQNQVRRSASSLLHPSLHSQPHPYIVLSVRYCPFLIKR